MLPSQGLSSSYKARLVMLFNSFQYLVFLPAVVVIFWLSPTRLRHCVLLVASYFFYMSWLKSYGLLLGALTALNYMLGLLISKLKTAEHRRLALVAGLAGNLGCLALYKYTNFLIETGWRIVAGLHPFLPSFFHLPAPGQDAWQLPIILPLGISFFVFEFIHYLTDVYRGSAPILSPVRFGLFAAFFPSQIAGPIKRYQDFDRQVGERRPFDARLFERGLWLVVEGMFKKVVLGDNLAPLVEMGFAAPGAMGTADAWLCVVAFALQIYYDFSGYTDIGRGSAMLFGVRLPENFNMPYIARNLSDFWRRWHISLSTWLRDYLYIPLGGSRGSKLKTAQNLLTTMLLGGLWHGASWHFVIWGGFHGVGLAVTHWWQSLTKRIPALESLRETAAWDVGGRLATFLIVLIGWVLFRADNMVKACQVYAAMFSLRASPDTAESVARALAESVLPAAFTAYGATFLFLRFLAPKLRLYLAAAEWRQLRWWLSPPVSAKAVCYLGLAVLILGFASHKSMPFIYFQF